MTPEQIQAIHDSAHTLGATCAGAPVKAAFPSPVNAIKSLGGDRIGTYMILFGSESQPDISEDRDFFTKATDFWLDKMNRRPMVYNHAMDKATKAEPVVGVWDKAEIKDELGVWFEGQLDANHRYREAIGQLIEAEALGASSDSAPQFVKRTKMANNTNRVDRWPILAGSLTPYPAEPRMMQLPVSEIKAAFKSIGAELPALKSKKAKPVKAEVKIARKTLATVSFGDDGSVHYTPESIDPEPEQKAIDGPTVPPIGGVTGATAQQDTTTKAQAEAALALMRLRV